MAVSTVNAGYNPFHDPNSSVYPRHGSLYAADDPTTPTVAVLENGDGEFIVAGCVTGMVYGVFPAALRSRRRQQRSPSRRRMPFWR